MNEELENTDHIECSSISDSKFNYDIQSDSGESRQAPKFIFPCNSNDCDYKLTSTYDHVDMKTTKHRNQTRNKNKKQNIIIDKQKRADDTKSKGNENYNYERDHTYKDFVFG